MSGSWVLRIWGRVAREVSFDVERIDALPRIEVSTQLVCPDREAPRTRVFAGVPTREILGRVQLDPAAAWVLAHGSDGLHRCLPLARFAAADSLLAREVDGRPLGPDNGGPCRLVVPRLGLGGSVKGLVGLEVLAKPWGQVSH